MLERKDELIPLKLAVGGPFRDNKGSSGFISSIGEEFEGGTTSGGGTSSGVRESPGACRVVQRKNRKPASATNTKEMHAAK